jgi:phosphoenolpyruvate-protein kinase (PTS system EI component)
MTIKRLNKEEVKMLAKQHKEKTDTQVLGILEVALQLIVDRGLLPEAEEVIKEHGLTGLPEVRI